MKLKDFLNSEHTHIETYGAKRVKYNKEESIYYYENNTLVALNTFDPSKSLQDFFSVKVKEQLLDMLDGIESKPYTNQDNFTGILYLDETTNLTYQETLNESLASIAMLDATMQSFPYLIYKVTNDSEEMLVYIKLKTPIKIENNQFYVNPTLHQLKIGKDSMSIDNYPTFTIDVENIPFIYYNQDFYVLDKELYQKYFNLNTHYQVQAENMVYHDNNIISDGNLLTKANAKFVCENFELFKFFINEIEDESISKESIQQVIDTWSLSLQYQPEDNKFILKRPKDLIDVILLSSSCLGINSITNQPYKVKRPNYLANE